MAGLGWTPSARRLARAAAIVALLVVIGAVPGGAPVGDVRAQAMEPRLGDAVPYFGPEGDEVATVAVAEAVDPFRAYEPNNPPQRGSRFVLLRLAVETTGSRAFLFDPSAVALQDTLGFLAFPQYVNRGPEAAAADPDLVFGEVAAGGRLAGVVTFQVVNDAELARVVYLPSRDRLVILADLGGEAGDGDQIEAAADPTEPARPMREPEPEPDDATPSSAPPPISPVVVPPAEPVDDSPEISLPDVLVAGATPEPVAPATAEAGAARFANAEFGFALAYDAATWTAEETTDGLTLANGVSTVRLSASDLLPADATACVETVAADLALTPSRQGYEVLRGEDGTPASGGTAEAAFAIHGFTGATGDIRFEQIVCVSLPAGRGTILLLHTGPLAAVGEELGAVQILLAGLMVAE